MFAISDPQIVLAYGLSIGFTLACIADPDSTTATEAREAEEVYTLTLALATAAYLAIATVRPRLSSVTGTTKRTARITLLPAVTVTR